MFNLAQLKKGERAIIKSFEIESMPLKLLEMGCLPGNEVELIQFAPFLDPIHIDINGTHLVIRKETALMIEVVKIS